MMIDSFVWTPVFRLIIFCIVFQMQLFVRSVTTLHNDLTGSDFFKVNMSLIEMLLLLL